ncbi:MAG: sensor histidine kinase [Clostridiales bacterium]|nr:sensor histidine kinase [Clostridiales bacterium]
MTPKGKGIRTQRRFGITARLVALTVLFTVVIAAVVLCSSVSYLSIQTRQTSLQASEYQLETAAASLSQRVTEVDDLVNWCTVNTTVRTYLLTSISGNLANTLYTTVQDQYNSVSVSTYIQRLLLYSSDGDGDSKFIMLGTAISQSVSLTDERLLLLPGLDGEDTAWASVVSDPLMQPGSTMQGIPVTATASSTSGNYTLKVYLSVSPSLITDVLRQFSLEDGASLYWVMGDTVYRVEGDSLTPVSADGVQLEADEESGATLDEGTLLYRAEINGDACSVIACPVGVHDLYLAEAIPDVPFSQLLPQLLKTMAFLVIAILFFGLLLMLLLRRLVRRPILALQRQIDTLAQGDFSANPEIEWNHELGDVGRGINRLSQSITTLMDKRVEDEKKRMDLEYQMLQSQINPHFIYNTLNSVKWMATIQHAPGIVEMVTALARLLKSVSKSTQRLVPLEQELSLLGDYFTIQRYRYGGTIVTEVRNEAGEQILADCLIPQFTLQPLAENAIFHGIEPKGCAGQLTVTVCRDEAQGDVLVKLEDDGVGMPPEVLANALREPSEEEAQEQFRHVGLWNVHRRLQYSFGPGYGLSLESTPGVGTTVTVRLPMPQANLENQSEGGTAS